MEWAVFLTAFVTALSVELGPAVGGSIMASGLIACLGKLRETTKNGKIDIAAARAIVGEHFPHLNEKLGLALERMVELRLDHKDILDSIEPLGVLLRDLQRREGLDRGVLDTLENRTLEILDLLKGHVLAGAARERFDAIRQGVVATVTSLRRYDIARDIGDDNDRRLMRALDLHPESVYLENLLPRPSVFDQVPAEGNVLVTGIPGAGKTTTMYQILQKYPSPAVVVAHRGFGSDPRDAERLLYEELPEDFAFVYDNIQWSAEHFRDAVLALQDAFKGKMRLLCACRSTDMPKVKETIPGMRECLKLPHEVKVPALDADEIKKVMQLCADQWKIRIEQDLFDQAAKWAGKAYATPFYVISLLARFGDLPETERVARLHDILKLLSEALSSVHAIWKAYFDDLSYAEQSFLRSLRFVHEMNIDKTAQWVGRIAEGVYKIKPQQLLEAEDRLRRLFWLTDADDAYSCYDVQFEAIDLDERQRERFVEWALGLGDERYDDRAILFKAGNMEYYRPAKTAQHGVRAKAFSNARKLFEAGLAASRHANEDSDTASFANNLANCLSHLASAAESDTERREFLRKAVAAVEEAVGIRRRLNLPTDLAGSLNNASPLYSDLAAAESDDARRKFLQKAVAAIEEAADLYRRLNLPADLAGSLTNASGYYCNLASAAVSDDERRDFLQKAVAAVEEAVELYRRLNLQGNLATSLNNASNCCENLASAAASDDERRDFLQKAVTDIKEAVAICRRLKLPADLAMSLNNASVYYGSLSFSAESEDERRDFLQTGVAAVEEAANLYRRLNLPAGLAASLNNASSRYSALAAGAESSDERREFLEKAAAAVEEASDLNRRLNLPTDLALSLGTMRDVRMLQAEQADLPNEELTFLVQAAEAIDEAISLFERVGLKHWLLQAYRHGVETHLRLAGRRRESLEKLVEYAKKGAALHRAYNQHETAERLEGVVKRLEESGEQGD